MRIIAEPFDVKNHLDPAAALLAGRHARDREREPLLPAAFEQHDACRAEIEAALTGHHFGAVARCDGQLVGFAISTSMLVQPTHYTASFFPPRVVNVGYTNHAAKAGLEYDVYRELYGAIAEHWVPRGFFDHMAYIAASDAGCLEAWTSLSFGRELAAAIRGVDPVERAGAEIEVHQASSEDANIIFVLTEELNLHHARSPIYWPMIRESEESSHEFSRELLEDSANAHFVAYADGKPAGMNTFMAPTWISPMIAPEKTVYLYQGIVAPDARAGGVGSALLAHGVEWARGQGYEHVALHFASPNISGARFWQSSGFRPVEYRMRRHVDERIAWANK